MELSVYKSIWLDYILWTCLSRGEQLTEVPKKGAIAMPIITLSEAYDSRLKELVTEPFEQTRESIIEGLIDAEMSRRSVSPNGNRRWVPVTGDVLHLNPDSHASLSHTRLLEAAIDARAVHRPKWNVVREEIHILALKRLGSFGAIQKASGANLRQGKYEDNGYKYLPSADLSIQGVGADLAWDHCLRLARAINVPITVTFEWRDKEGAAHRGKRGILEWNPKES